MRRIHSPAWVAAGLSIGVPAWCGCGPVGSSVGPDGGGEDAGCVTTTTSPVCSAGRCAYVLATCQNPSAIAVEGAYVYWTDHGTLPNNGTVMKVATSGGIPTTLASGQNSPSYIA